LWFRCGLGELCLLKAASNTSPERSTKENLPKSDKSRLSFD
jgi:hypothetical protein